MKKEKGVAHSFFRVGAAPADLRRANMNLRYHFKARSNAIRTLLAAHTRFAEQIKVSPIKTRASRAAPEMTRLFANRNPLAARVITSPDV